MVIDIPPTAISYLNSLILHNRNMYPCSHVLPAILVSPSTLPTILGSPETLPMSLSNIPDLTPSSSASDTTECEDDTYSVADPQLLEYSKEPSMSWEILKEWMPLVPGEEAGIWQFITANEICQIHRQCYYNLSPDDSQLS
jgi:hypothetical protein